MAREKISSRTNAGYLTGAEIVPVVRMSEPTPGERNLQTTVLEIANFQAITAYTADSDIGASNGAFITDEGSEAIVTLQVLNVAVGTRYTFFVVANGIEVRGNNNEQNFVYVTENGNDQNTQYILMSGIGRAMTMTKISSDTWAVFPHIGIINND